MIVHAQGILPNISLDFSDIAEIYVALGVFVLNILISIIFLYFVINTIKVVRSEGEQKSKLLVNIVGMFLAFSFWGIIYSIRAFL